MLLRQLKEDEDEPPRPLNASVIPIAAAVKAANEDVKHPQSAEIVQLGQIRPKRRSDFDSQIDYDLYVEFQRLQARSYKENIRTLNEAVAVVEVEESEEHIPSDLPMPLSGAEGALLDDEARYHAYLSHYTPTHYLKLLRPKGRMTLGSDGQLYKVARRQDACRVQTVTQKYPLRVRPQYVVQITLHGDQVKSRRIIRDSNGNQRSMGQNIVYGVTERTIVDWNTNEVDGLCMMLSDSRTRDIQRGKNRTRASKKKRRKFGKPENTVYQNRVNSPHDYRPVPSLQELIRHPEGHGLIYDEPYPHGPKDHLADEINAEHNRRAALLMNDILALTKKGARDVDPERIQAIARSHRLSFEEEVRRLENDDLPWSYDEEATPTDPVTPIHQDSTPESGRLAPAESIEYRADGSKPQLLKSYRVQPVRPRHSNTEETEAANQSVSTPVMLVRENGDALPTRTADPQMLFKVAKWWSTQEPIKDEVSTMAGPTAEDLNDPRYLPLIENQIRFQRARVAAEIEHLEHLVEAKMGLEATARLHGNAIAEVEDPVNIEYERGPRLMQWGDLTHINRWSNRVRYPKTRVFSENYSKFLATQNLYAHKREMKLASYVRQWKARLMHESMEKQAAIKARRLAKCRAVSEVAALRRIGETGRHMQRLRNIDTWRTEAAMKQIRSDLFSKIREERAFLSGLAKRHQGQKAKFRAIIDDAKRRVRKHPWTHKLRVMGAFLAPNRVDSGVILQEIEPEEVRAQPERRAMPTRYQELVEEPQVSLILPEREVIVFGDESMKAELERYKRQLMKSGVRAEELEGIEIAFKRRAWDRFVKHAEARHILVA